MRYTKNNVHYQIDHFNAQLNIINHPNMLVMSGRNGYQGLDLFTNEGTCLRTIAIGTSRDCLEAAQSYMINVLAGYISNLILNKE